MVIKTPKLGRKIPRQLPKFARLGRNELTVQDVAAARKYIADYWPKLTRVHTKDDDTLLGLPYPYLVPSLDEKNEFDYNDAQEEACTGGSHRSFKHISTDHSSDYTLSLTP